MAHMPADSTTVTAEEMESLMGDLNFPIGRPMVPVEGIVVEWGPLGVEHAEVARDHVEAAQPMGVAPSPIKALRNSHHRLAQLLAIGTPVGVAAQLCNYALSRVSLLKSDPAFQELLAFYSNTATEVWKDQWAEFQSTATELSMDFLQELRARLDDNPEKLTPAFLLEAMKVLADRTGNAPVQRTHNVNVNIGLGDRLRKARERSNAAIIDSTARVVE